MLIASVKWLLLSVASEFLCFINPHVLYTYSPLLIFLSFHPQTQLCCHTNASEARRSITLKHQRIGRPLRSGQMPIPQSVLYSEVPLHKLP